MAPTALAFSIALHAGLGMWVGVRGEATRDASFREKSRIDAPDVWAGRGVDAPSAVPLDDTLVSVDTLTGADLPGGAESPEAPAPPAVIACPACAPTEAHSEAKPEPEPVSPAEPAGAPPPTTAERATQMPTRTARAPSTSRPEKQQAPSPPASLGSPSADAPGAATPSAAPAYGAEGLPIGVRHLPKAFWRALPKASYRMAEFRTLPVGKLGEARFTLSVSPEGKLGDVEYASDEEEQSVPRVIRRMLENTMILLRAGTFSVDPQKLAPGSVRFRVVVEVSDREPLGDGPVDDNMTSLGGTGEPPAPGRPGHRSFTLNSGRHVDAWIHLD